MLAPALLAGAALWWASTPRGLGVTADSTIYLHAARSLAEGRGLLTYTREGSEAPLTHYPPLLPATLAAATRAGVELAAAARFAGVITYSLNVLAMGLLTYLCTRNRWSASLAAVLFLVGPPVVYVQSMVWTEPWFMLMAMASLAAVARFIVDNRARWLILAAVFGGMSALTRYAGGAVVLGGAAAIMALGAADWRRRVVSAVAFVCLCSVGLAAWVLRNHLAAGGNATDRHVGFHPPPAEQLGVMLQSLQEWIPAPQSLQPFATAGLATLAALGAAYLWSSRRQTLARVETPKKEENSPWRYLPHTLATFIAAYMAFLVLATTFADAAIQFDQRSLAPIYGPIVLLAVVGAHRVCRRRGQAKDRTAAATTVQRISRMTQEDMPGNGESKDAKTAASAPTTCLFLTRVVKIVAVGLAVAGAARACGQFRAMHDQGVGYSSARWERSPLIAKARSLPPGTWIVTNRIDTVTYLAGRCCAELPTFWDDIADCRVATYESDLAAMALRLRQSGGVMLLFDCGNGLLPSREELSRRLPLEVVAHCEDGVVCRIRK